MWEQFAGGLLAADSTSLVMTPEYDFPMHAWQWVLYGGGFVAAFAVTIYFYLRDSKELSRFWRAWLLVLRLSVLAALVVIAINPRQRTQKVSYRPSRVAVLVDTSLSMRYPERMPQQDSEVVASRTEAVQELLTQSTLIEELREKHDVSLYTFDSQLEGPHQVFRRDFRTESNAESTTGIESDPSGEKSLDWDEVLRARGLETRLGETVLNLVRQLGGKTLSGIVLLSDGAANSGIDPDSAANAARAANARILTVGVGSVEQPVNLQLASLQAPTDVFVGDQYEISAFVRSQGLEGRNAIVELQMRAEGEELAPAIVASEEILLAKDGLPTEVKFRRDPVDTGSVEYFVEVKTPDQIRELSMDDNRSRKTIHVIDRKLRVLLIAGGPMRDYRFVRNMLYRHSAVEVDIWLQSADRGAAISQESDRLLMRFPEKREDFFNYDVVVAFDPDWQNFPPNSVEMLAEWVYRDSGGVILVAGEVNTPKLASAAGEMEPILDLYPVVLNSYLLDLQFQDKAEQAWPIEFTRDGSNAGFLQLADDPLHSTETWERFGGVYRCYPTGGSKAGATIFANFTDPRTQTEHGQPILIASQFYGSGRILYIGTGELWRLRSIDEEYYDRFWTKAVRDVGQSRLKRGTNRGTLLMERNQYVLGQTVRVRGQLRDPQFNDLTEETAKMEVYDPTGKPMIPARVLTADPNRTGQYVGDFRVSQTGVYKIVLPIPDSSDELIEKIDVTLPNLESDQSRQNIQLLRKLAEDSQGTYFPLELAAKEIPGRLPNRGEEYLVDERLRTLWDRQWVMLLLVAFLSTEWLTRKLLKLA